MPQKFPGPYTNDCKEQDPIMERVPLPTMGIGARPSGLPKGAQVESGEMTIKHVEGGAKAG